MTAVADHTVRWTGTQLGQSLKMPLVAALAYYLGAEAAFFVGTFSDKMFAPFWPPNVVLFCALLLTPRSRWWIFIAAVFPAHVIAELGVGMNTPALLVAFATNCMVAVINAAAVQIFLGRAHWFSNLRRAAIYMLITVVAGPAVSAFGGAFVQVYAGGALDHYLLYVARWYVSNALGMVTLAPLAMVLLTETGRAKPHELTARHVEAVLIAVALAVTCAVAFNVTPAAIASGYLPALLYLPVPIVLWATLRFGVKGASGAVLIVGMVLMWRGLNGPSLFVVSDAEANVFALQLFLVGLAAPMILLSAAIEEVHHAERVRRINEERIAFAAASSNLGLWQYDFATGEFWATEHCRTMFGLPAQANIDFNTLLARIFPHDKQPADAIKSAIERRVPFDIEFRYGEPTHSDARWFATRGRPNFDATGKTVAMTGAFADITARKAADAEALLRQQEITHLMRVSMLGELSGGLAHELTQPLTAILSNAQAGRMMVKQGGANQREIADIFDDIITEDGRAGEVIHRLRGLLKKGEVRFESLDANEMIVSTMRLLHSEMINRRVVVRTDLAANLALVRGDTVQLQQVLINLFMNAIDAMEEISPSRRTILVSTTMNGNDVEVKVSDRGTGVPPANGAHLFRPFFTTKKRGLGLGLSICSSIVKSHEGVLSLANNAGEGATATLRLPAHRM